MNYLVKLLIVISLLRYGITIQAQNVIPSTGGNAAGSGGTASYTIGQVIYTTNSGTSGSSTQGVQQPYEISIVTGIEQAKDIHLVCSAYPNPTTDFLTLRVENYDKENLMYRLYNNRGILLEDKKVTGNETTISMSGFISGTYFLKVSDNNNEVKIFKIVKI